MLCYISITLCLDVGLLLMLCYISITLCLDVGLLLYMDSVQSLYFGISVIRSDAHILLT